MIKKDKWGYVIAIILAIAVVGWITFSFIKGETIMAGITLFFTLLCVEELIAIYRDNKNK